MVINLLFCTQKHHLALSRCVGVSVVVKDVVLREIASTFKEIATHTLDQWTLLACLV